MLRKRPVVLTLLSHYLPGFRAGGPIRTLANLVERLGDEFDFRILTSDRDLGDEAPYTGIQTDTWITQGKARVMYISPQWQRLRAWLRLLRSFEYDILYLNSFFSVFTRKTLLWRRLGRISAHPVILAPRGEFSPGALRLKKHKKLAYLATVGRLGFYRDIIWQASNREEAAFIQNVCRRFHLDRDPVVYIASNLPAALPVQETVSNHSKESGSLRLIFLGRLAKMKNLTFALESLEHIQGHVQFDIYGPLEDEGYWRLCEGIIARLPENVCVTYHGPVSPESVGETFARYHAFLFPTLGENFGHVILESLAAGCPVVVSDRTSWRNLLQKQAGWDLPLEQPETFQQAIQQLVDMDQATWKVWSAGARRVADAFIGDPALLEANRELFYLALNKRI